MLKTCLKKSVADKTFLFLAFIVFTGCASQQVKTETKPWPTYLYNESRSNVSADRLSLPLVVMWDKDISPFRIFNVFPKEQLSSPALTNGVLYVGSENERFYTLDLKSGKVLWKFDADHPIEAPPSVYENYVCFGSSNGLLRCFDSSSGKLLWSFQAKSEILSSPIIKDGKVYFSSSDDRFYALSLNTGEKLWSYNRNTFQTVTPRIYASPAFSNNRLYQLFSDGYLVCLSVDAGKELWSKKMVKNFDAAERPRRTPLIDNGLVYVVDETNAIQALSEETGEVKGIYNIIKAYDFILADKRSLVIAGADKVIAIDRMTGSILWKKDLKFSPASTIFAADEHLFVLSNYRHAPWGINFLAKDKGYITALRLKDGETVWGGDLASNVTANASSSESRAAVLTNEGILEVFGSK